VTDFDAIADEIAARGWCAADQFVPPALSGALRGEARMLWQAGAFHAAGVGGGLSPAVRPDVRGDHIRWLEPEAASVTQQACLARFEDLRLALNRNLQLGLFDFECHFALYPAGAHYARHLDRFKGDARRALSCVLYLNEDWQPEDGGQLRLYLDERRSLELLPRGGTLVAFLSERFEHEVLPAHRERISLTGWFRRRDPAA
jgi:SM-20-related protein